MVFLLIVLFKKQFLSTFIDYFVASYRFVEDDLLIATGVFNLLLTRLFETVTTSEKNRRGKSILCSGELSFPLMMKSGNSIENKQPLIIKDSVN